MVFGFLGAAMVARVFGPENMGRLSIVYSVSNIFIVIATLGLDHFVLREFTRKNDDQTFKGSLLAVQFLGWLLYVTVVISYFVLKGNLQSEFYLIASVVFTTLFSRVIYLKLYLQAINHAKTIMLAATFSRVFALGFLVIGSLDHFGYDTMIMYLPIQAFIQAIIMWFGYHKVNKFQDGTLSFSWQSISPLIKEAMPVLIATLIYFGYSQADVLIVSYFMSEHDVGIYAAAMRLIPQAAFIGHIAAITYYSAISKSYDTNFNLFISQAKKVFKLQFMLGLTLAFIGFSMSKIIIFCLYGEKFDQSAEILSVGVWAWVFIFPAALFSRLLVLSNLAKFELFKAVTVAPISLCLNFLLIPKFGPIAAAWVTVMTYFMGDFLVYSIFKKTRFMFFMGIGVLIEILSHPLDSAKECFKLITEKHV